MLLSVLLCLSPHNTLTLYTTSRCNRHLYMLGVCTCISIQQTTVNGCRSVVMVPMMMLVVVVMVVMMVLSGVWRCL